MRYLVTGAAGFIGFHAAKALLARGDTVLGLDNMNNYYSPALKQNRLRQLYGSTGFSFVRGDLTDHELMTGLFTTHEFDKVCHLAAQAGVRYSLIDPDAYLKSNLEGFLSILELCRSCHIKNLVYASSSSVYGSNKNAPFRVQDRTDNPLSLYAATKKANELMAYAYHHLYGLKCTGLRFFTVYGPWGRPDMAYFKFTKAILAGDEIEVYNYGRMKRDYTYIDDVIAGVLAALDRDYEWELFNLGSTRPVELTLFIECLERQLGRTARKRFLPLQAGDMETTCADIAYSIEKLGFAPATPIEVGIGKFTNWYQDYFGINTA